ncbi:ABC transporter permease [Nocardia sp. BMG51109]|uniref:ABC transporter permease n=1 Tax=Nocardia sp. BMG51109 TaxID=1056816 RepID=UPI000467E8CE|nr:ABC transporter permease [Nocardia sp. BMG51109]
MTDVLIKEESDRTAVAGGVRPAREEVVSARPRRRFGRAVVPTLAVTVLLVIVLWALFPSLFAHQDPFDGVTAEKFQGPSARHLFGTDNLGRDIFSRTVHGTRSSLLTAVIAVAIALVAGSLLGLTGGYFRGAIDAVIGRFTDALLAVPSFLLAMVVVTSLGFSTTNAAIATGISAVAIFARLMRSEVLRVTSLNYVESSRLVGCGPLTVLFVHVLPNVYRSVIALAVLQFGMALIVIAGLAYLGYGNPPPAPDWGILVSDGKNYMDRHWWIVFFPGLVIIVTCLSLNRASRLLAVTR